jgi:1A family penicillin-binding protein
MPKKPVRRSRKPRSSPNPRVRKTSPRTSWRQKGRRLIVVACLVSLAATYFAWVSIDRKVISRLTTVHNPRLPVIYSAAFDLGTFVTRLGGFSTKNVAEVRSVLTERRYTEVPSRPSRPGEFSVSEIALQIYTRAYTDHTGDLIPAHKETIPWVEKSEGARRVLVEPQVISYIGAADVRASSFVPLASIPAIVQKAVLSIEDERFYKHFGLDPVSIARAAVRNILAFRLVEGGSTLTQQLAKNLFLSPKRSFSRKFMEIPTALSIEQHMSKQQILELYLNEVYLGQEGAVAIHGMPEAASAFFGKKLEDLKVDEAATLAGMIKAPSLYNPRRFAERAKDRRNTVLAKMHQHGHITDAEWTVARAKPIITVPRQEHRRLAPFFTTALESELSSVVDLDTALGAGLAVYTGIDLGLQRCAEEAVERGLQTLEASHPRLTKGGRRLEGALVAIEPYSGLIRSWVGGRDFSASQFNRVSQANRQAGSTVKPFLYLTALDGSLNSYKVATTISILEDKPMEFRLKGQKAWNPENYDHDYRGDVTVRYALENSLNMPALYIAERVGLPALKRTVQQFGLSSQDFSAVPSLALGALDTNLLRLTSAYGALANGGIYVEPRLYSSALDADNERLSAPRIRERRVADEAATFVLTNILQGTLDRGTGKAARSKGFTAPAAGKTGTSDHARDAWFIGFTPTLSAGVWVGFDDNAPMNLTGGAAAAPIWGSFMSCAAQYTTGSSFIPPREVTFARIDADTGAIATENCPDGRATQELFVRGTEPNRTCPHHPGNSTRLEDQVDGEGQRDRGFWSRFIP